MYEVAVKRGLIRDAFPDAVVATIESAAFFSLDEKHWPNLSAAGHDRLSARKDGGAS